MSPWETHSVKEGRTSYILMCNLLFLFPVCNCLSLSDSTHRSSSSPPLSSHRGWNCGEVGLCHRPRRHLHRRILKLLSWDLQHYEDAPTEGICRVLEEVDGRLSCCCFFYYNPVFALLGNRTGVSSSPGCRGLSDWLHQNGHHGGDQCAAGQTERDGGSWSRSPSRTRCTSTHKPDWSCWTWCVVFVLHFDYLLTNSACGLPLFTCLCSAGLFISLCLRYWSLLPDQLTVQTDH